MSDLTNYAGVFGHNIGVPPNDKPKIIAFNGIQLLAGQPKRLDLRDLVGASVIDTLQSIYLDNDNNTRVIAAIENASGHRIIGLAYTQGWYPIPLLENEALLLTAVANASVNIALANVNIIAGPWKTQ
jgi:hypothetical protein